MAGVETLQLPVKQETEQDGIALGAEMMEMGLLWRLRWWRLALESEGGGGR